MIYHSKLTLLLSCLLIACGHIEKTEDLAKIHGFTKQLIRGGDFQLTTYQKILEPNQDYVFYIEGDGRPIIKGQFISDDPTPKAQTLFNLASIDTRPNIIYMARPCQYTPKNLNPKCYNSKYWTDLRMGSEVTLAMFDAIETISDKHNYSLIGYSGGGGMAILIARNNPKVKDIITIAGNLDINAFNNYHKVKPKLAGLDPIPMNGSLNPIDYAKETKNITQLHLVGEKDIIVPEFIALNFTKASNSNYVKYKVIPNVSHRYGWNKIWSKILTNVTP
jgi:hypothetical protein